MALPVFTGPLVPALVVLGAVIPIPPAVACLPVVPAAVVAVMVITVLPAPDGRYVSDIRAREETLQTIDQTFFAQL